jgi:hypothetical protein
MLANDSTTTDTMIQPSMESQILQVTDLNAKIWHKIYISLIFTTKINRLCKNIQLISIKFPRMRNETNREIPTVDYAIPLDSR